MDLQSAAEKASERRTRSKLEAHREVIFALRRKHWTHRQIAAWLNEHGVQITLSSVHRFCQRAIARRPRNSSPLEIAEEKPASVQQTQSQTSTKPANPHRFNTDI